MALPKNFTFSVPALLEDGFLSRECAGQGCGKHFTVHQDDLKAEMYCPYCGLLFSKEDLFTKDQRDYFVETIRREVTPLLVDELRRSFRNSFKGPNWKVTQGPPVVRRPPPEPPPIKKVDSQLTCPLCSVRFQVDGIFGYCPGCRSENLLLYDANLAVIRNEVAVAADPARALRHAYTDVVSSFEIFCRKECERRSVAAKSLQNLELAKTAFQSALGVDIFGTLEAGEFAALRRAFQKRHAYEHNGGMIDAKYIKIVPEDAALLGTKAELSLTEFELAATALRKVLSAIVGARP